MPLLLAACEFDPAPGRLIRPGPLEAAGNQVVIDVTPEQAQREQVRKVQRRLARLGYEPGNSDGVAGAKTRTAIHQYQADRGLTRDGLISQRLLHHLAETIADRPYQPVTWLPSRLPGADYEPGDSFIYSNGRIDTVTAVQGDRVYWRSNQDTVFQTYKNFVLPWLAWRSPQEAGLRRVQADADLLWPLLLGEEHAFTTTRMARLGDRPENIHEVRESWRCGAEGRAPIALVTGTFETVTIACERQATGELPRLKRIWYYAPRLRHYVRVVDLDENGEPGHQIDLVAIQPTGPTWPPIVRTGLRQTLERALRTLPSGESALWESTAVGAQVTIRPDSRSIAFDGAHCRALWQTFSRAGKHRSYPGLACRATKGRWQVLGFQDSGLLLDVLARSQALRSLTP